MPLAGRGVGFAEARPGRFNLNPFARTSFGQARLLAYSPERLSGQTGHPDKGALDMQARISVCVLFSCVAFSACSRAAMTDPHEEVSATQVLESGSGRMDGGSAQPALRLANAGTGSDVYGAAIGIRAGYQTCMSHQLPPVSTAGHRQECADEEFAFQDARLNAVYRELMGLLKAAGPARSTEAAALRDQQRAWLQQLDSECVKQAEAAGSTMGPAVQSTCLMERTASRARELERRRSKID